MFPGAVMKGFGYICAEGLGLRLEERHISPVPLEGILYDGRIPLCLGAAGQQTSFPSYDAGRRYSSELEVGVPRPHGLDSKVESKRC